MLVRKVSVAAALFVVKKSGGEKKSLQEALPQFVRNLITD